jgi:2-dehydropantoate 2-reductase
MNPLDLKKDVWMRILVIGAGALGGYFGACLARAGRDVTFMVRPRRAEQLSRAGLNIVSPHGDFVIFPNLVMADGIQGSFDVILVGLKSYSLDDAMEEFAPAVGPNTMILPILNGMKHLDRLTGRFGAEPVLGGMANISAGLDAEGRVVQFFPNHELAFGEVAGGSSTRTSALEALFKGAGISGRASDTVMHDMWEKFVQLSTVAGITCLMRASIGDILAAPGGREAIFRLFDECCAIASASGFEPRPAFIEFDRTLFTTANSPLKASMLRDIERGSVTEGEHILGDMVSRARALRIGTPLLDLARAHVAAYEVGRARGAASGK